MKGYCANNDIQNKTPKIISCYYILCMLWSLHAYMFWHVDNVIIIPSIFVLTSYIHIFYYKYFSYGFKSPILFAVIAIVFGTYGNLNGYIFNFFKLLPYLSFFLLKDDHKTNVYILWKNVFALILTISLVWFVMVVNGFSLPYVMDNFGDSSSDSFYLAKNYFLLIHVESVYTGLTLDRFQSIFLEPGYLACLIVMMLFIDKFNFKKNKINYILVIALLFTFSVAGFSLFAIFYILCTIKCRGLKIIPIVNFTLVVLSFYLYGILYNDGDNEINHRIIERLQFDSERGTIEGYNRTTEDFDIYFSQFICSSDVVFGNAEEYKMRFAGEGANVGLKYFIMNYGLLGLFSYLMFLYSPFLKKIRKSYFTITLLLLWFIVFARGNFVMWMSAFLIIFAYGLISLDKDQQIEKDNVGDT